jgi:hypothetical protein
VTYRGSDGCERLRFRRPAERGGVGIADQACLDPSVCPLPCEDRCSRRLAVNTIDRVRGGQEAEFLKLSLKRDVLLDRSDRLLVSRTSQSREPERALSVILGGNAIDRTRNWPRLRDAARPEH